MIFSFTIPELYCSYTTSQLVSKLFSENSNNFQSDMIITIAGLLELTIQTKTFSSS